MNRQLTRDDVDLRERFFSLRNVRDVADLLEVPLGTLNWHLYRRHVDRSYTAFRIAKKCGGHRSISTPVTPLKMLQEKLSRVLYLAYSTKPPVHGFAHHRSIVSNASRHVGKPYILNIDIADFFPSITFPRLHGMFKAKPYNLPERVAAVLAHMCCYKQKLPQGAPTSPVVSNMLCAQMDSQLRGLARSVRWEYTRYADDMSFSPATEKKYLPQKLLDVTYSDGVMHVDVGDAVRAIVEANHFHLNEEKARFLRSHRTQLVTGLVVNQRVNVRKRWMSDLRGMVWAWEKHGLKAAEARFLQDYCHKRANARDPGSYGPSFPSVVQGKLAFLSSVRGEDDAQYRFLQNRVDKLQGKTQRFPFIHCKDPKRSVWVYDDPLTQSRYRVRP